MYVYRDQENYENLDEKGTHIAVQKKGMREECLKDSKLKKKLSQCDMLETE